MAATLTTQDVMIRLFSDDEESDFSDIFDEDLGIIIFNYNLFQ